MGIVAAVGSLSTGKSRHGELGKRIEAAMAAAVRDCLAQGIPMEDTDTYRDRQLQARQAVIDEFNNKK